MRKKISALFCALAVMFTSVTSNAELVQKSHYNYWDFETGSYVMTEEGEELWEEALEARRENPAANKDWPEAYPLKCVERLTFKAKVKGKNLAYKLKNAAGNGSTIECSISQYRYQWILNIKGKGGAFALFIDVPAEWEGYNHNTTGSILKFFEFLHMDENGQQIWDYDEYGTGDGLTYRPEIHLRGETKNGKIKSLQLWEPIQKVWDEDEGDYKPLFPFKNEDTKGEFYWTEGQTDILDCYDIEYEYYGDPEKFENGRNLCTLLGVSHDEKAYIEELEKKKEFREKYAYDEGPANNHKTPLRYKTWNGKTDGGFVQWDFNVLFAGKANIYDFNAGMYQYLRGVGGYPTVSLIGLETTRDGKPYSPPYPMLRVKGDKGEVWFNMADIRPRSDDGGDGTNPRAVYVALTKLKDFKDFVKYEDLTAPEEEITMVLYFKDDELTELDRIVFDFGPMNVPGRETWTVEGEDFDFTGDIASLMESYNADYDYFGYVLEELGIEL